MQFAFLNISSPGNHWILGARWSQIYALLSIIFQHSYAFNNDSEMRMNLIMPWVELFPYGKKICVCITAFAPPTAINYPAMKLNVHLSHCHEHYLCGQLQLENINTAYNSVWSPSNSTESAQGLFKDWNVRYFYSAAQLFLNHTAVKHYMSCAHDVA